MICYFEGEYNIEGVWGRTGIQNNPFNLVSDTLQLRTIWHLRRAVPSLKIVSTRENLHQWNRQTSGTWSKRPPWLSYTRQYDMSWCLFSYSNNFILQWRPRKHRRGSWLPWTSRRMRYPKGITLWLIIDPKYKNSNKNYL